MPVPVAGHFTITQIFGPTSEALDSGWGVYPHFSRGVDFGVPVGTPIQAVASGTVISVGQVDNWGYSVKIQDANGFIHNYGHLSGATVSVGDVVGAGQQIAVSGNTGVGTGAHLSYDIYTATDGTPIDPTPWLGFMAFTVRDAAEGHPVGLTVDEALARFPFGEVINTEGAVMNWVGYADPSTGTIEARRLSETGWIIDSSAAPAAGSGGTASTDGTATEGGDQSYADIQAAYTDLRQRCQNGDSGACYGAARLGNIINSFGGSGEDARRAQQEAQAAYDASAAFTVQEARAQAQLANYVPDSGIFTGSGANRMGNFDSLLAASRTAYGLPDEQASTDPAATPTATPEPAPPAPESTGQATATQTATPPPASAPIELEVTRTSPPRPTPQNTVQATAPEPVGVRPHNDPFAVNQPSSPSSPRKWWRQSSIFGF